MELIVFNEQVQSGFREDISTLVTKFDKDER